MNAFPVEILPAKSVLAGSVSFAIGMAIVLTMAAILGKLTFHVFLVPVVMLAQYLFLIGVAWL
jgi:ABC-type polysaccharide/polyol phosphate export permease